MDKKVRDFIDNPDMENLKDFSAENMKELAAYLTRENTKDVTLAEIMEELSGYDINEVRKIIDLILLLRDI